MTPVEILVGRRVEDPQGLKIVPIKRVTLEDVPPVDEPYLNGTNLAETKILAEGDAKVVASTRDHPADTHGSTLIVAIREKYQSRQNLKYIPGNKSDIVQAGFGDHILFVSPRT